MTGFDFVFTDDLVGFASPVLVLNGDLRAKNNFIGRDGFGIDHLGVFDPIPKEHKPFVDLAQAALAVYIVPIFAAVTVAGGPGDGFNQFWAFVMEKLTKFFLEPMKSGWSYVICFFRHGITILEIYVELYTGAMVARG